MSEPCDQTGATRIAELRAELQKQKRAIAALTRKEKVADTRIACGSDTAWPFVVRGALIEWPRSRRAVGPWSQEQLRQKMNTLTETEKEQLLRPTSIGGQRALTAATKFLTERSLFAWVQKQNSDKGLAPSGVQGEPDAPQVCSEPISVQGEPDAPPVSDRAKRQRMRRWSRRWRVVQGRYKAGLRLPLETLGQKANGDSEV